jgi:hypothetical protein
VAAEDLWWWNAAPPCTEPSASPQVWLADMRLTPCPCTLCLRRRSIPWPCQRPRCKSEGLNCGRAADHEELNSALWATTHGVARRTREVRPQARRHAAHSEDHSWTGHGPSSLQALARAARGNNTCNWQARARQAFTASWKVPLGPRYRACLEASVLQDLDSCSRVLVLVFDASSRHVPSLLRVALPRVLCAVN